MENIEANQSYYLVDDKGSKWSFDQNLANIAPYDDESGSYTSMKTGHILNLDPDHGFIWDDEEETGSKTEIPPTKWPTVDEDDRWVRNFGSNFDLFGWK